jgi:hypothetical protein
MKAQASLLLQLMKAPGSAALVLMKRLEPLIEPLIE